jgi:hypothetical protein
MRNKSAFIFVLLANLVLLAHAVVPHHHHNEDPISISVKCCHHEEHNPHENALVNLEDHEDHETTACSLTQILLIPNNQFRTGEKSVDKESTDILFIALFVYNFSSKDNFAADSYSTTEIIPISTRFIISSQGLRAPPVC